MEIVTPYEHLKAVGMIARSMPNLDESPSERIARLESFRAFAEDVAKRCETMYGHTVNDDEFKALQDSIRTVKTCLEQLQRRHIRLTGQRYRG